VSTLILQSAFRYDYEKEKVKKAVAKLERELPKRKQIKLDLQTKRAILSAIPLFERHYRRSIENMAPLINKISSQVVRRRERMQHIGLFGYFRGIGKVRLPRAIPFTASLYSLGIPPEIIGVGRGIRQAKKKGLWSEVKPIYTHLKDDLIQSGYFVNKKNITRLAKNQAFWYDIIEDISWIEKEFDVQLGPKSPIHEEHFQLAEKIYEKIQSGGNILPLITRGGMLRKSLG
jgi:phosphoenolpyruvate carboxylase